MDNYICRAGRLEDVRVRWDHLIETASGGRDNWIVWKEENMDQFINGLIIPYYGFLDGEIICECTASVCPLTLSEPEGLVNEKTAYLSAFRTDIEHRGKGYFSRLFRFVLEDLRSRGYEKVTLGVEPRETKNKEIYMHLGFMEHIKDSRDIYPDGTVIDVEYYGRQI